MDPGRAQIVLGGNNVVRKGLEENATVDKIAQSCADSNACAEGVQEDRTEKFEFECKVEKTESCWWNRCRWAGGCRGWWLIGWRGKWKLILTGKLILLQCLYGVEVSILETLGASSLNIVHAAHNWLYCEFYYFISLACPYYFLL